MSSDSKFTALSKELTVSSADGSPVKLPLATRVIGGFLLLAGIVAMFDLLLDMLFGHHWGLNLTIGLALVGWGLLKRREWARALAAFVCVLGAGVGCLGFALACFMDADDITVSFGLGDISDISRRCLFAGLMLAYAILMTAAWRHLTSDAVTRLFQNHTPDDLFIVWNPRRWRFRISTLLFVTMVVAFIAVQLAQEPAVQRLGLAMGMVESPSFFKGLPDLPLGEGSEVESIGTGDGRIVGVQYGYHTPLGRLGPARLDYVVFKSTVGSHTFPVLTSSGSGRNSSQSAYLKLSKEERIRLPDKTQLFELMDGKLARSDMHISFAEFWSYLHSKGRENSLSALEEHVKQLRRDLAGNEE